MGYLRRVNEKASTQLEIEFGEERIQHEDSLRSDPLSALLEVYRSRPDLTSAYPEVQNGDYVRLIEWANHVITNRMDAYTYLEPYAKWYRKNPLVDQSMGFVRTLVAAVTQLRRV